MGIAIVACLLVHWAVGLWFMPADAIQGEVYRIIYLHVPSAFTAFFLAYVLLWQSIQGLRKQEKIHSNRGRAAAELGLLFSCLTLATGSIWGRPTWGVWWTWDARLTTTFILALLFAGYLLLWNALPQGPQRTRACSVLGFLIAIDIPIIYKSVTWWRTIHQPQSMLRPGGSTMAPEMVAMVVSGIVVMITVSAWLMWERTVNLELFDDLEEASYEKLKLGEAN
jgi:heme exporter protein C